MNEDNSTQGRLLANAAALSGGGAWGLYPGECSFARRLRAYARSPWPRGQPNNGKRLPDDQTRNIKADILCLQKRVSNTVTVEEHEQTNRLLALAMKTLAELKEESAYQSNRNRSGNYGKSY